MRSLFLQHIAQTSPEPMLLEIVRGEGSWLFDQDGKSYIDLISGISVSNVGHGNESVRKAIHDQTDRYLHTMVFGEYVQTPQVKFAEALIQHLPPNLESVYFVNSGSEAVEGAMKLAKRFTGKPNIVAMKNAYHGSTQGALSLMSSPYFSGPFRPLLPGIRFIDFNRIDELDQIDENTAAVVVELIQSESGYNPADRGFIRALRSQCNETGTLLIVDEIQTGMGRSGTLFAMEQYGIQPDIVCLAKALGGGMPIGAFISSKEIMSSLMDNPVLGHITTFGGHPVSCAAGLAALNEITGKNLLLGIADKETLFRSLLIHPEIHEITGTGLMLSIRLKSKAFLREVVRRCITKGLIIDWFLYAEHYLRVAPPLIISEDEIRKACAIILESLSESEDVHIDT